MTLLPPSLFDFKANPCTYASAYIYSYLYVYIQHTSNWNIFKYFYLKILYKSLKRPTCTENSVSAKPALNNFWCTFPFCHFGDQNIKLFTTMKRKNFNWYPCKCLDLVDSNISLQEQLISEWSWMWLFNYITYKMTLIKFLHKAYLMVSARTKFHKAAAWIFGTQTNTMNAVIAQDVAISIRKRWNTLRYQKSWPVYYTEDVRNHDVL